ncbi:MAG: hypothetical protein V4494_02375 [Chlamydiota bacterium]
MESRLDALTSTGRALLGVITPELRAVVVDLVEDVFYINFYYDGEVSEDLIDLWDCAITEASAGLDSNFGLDEYIERLDYPQKIPRSGTFAYLRKEPYVLDLYGLEKESKFLLKEDLFFVEREAGPLKSYGGILLAAQRALLGVVTPELRAVVVDFDDEELYVRFYYNGEVSLELIHEWEDAIAQINIDMYSYRSANGLVVRLDYPQEIFFRGRYAYLRKER